MPDIINQILLIYVLSNVPNVGILYWAWTCKNLWNDNTIWAARYNMADCEPLWAKLTTRLPLAPSRQCAIERHAHFSHGESYTKGIIAKCWKEVKCLFPIYVKFTCLQTRFLAFLQYFDRLMASWTRFMASSYRALFSSFRLLWRDNSLKAALFCTTRLISPPLTVGQINYESNVKAGV